MTCQRARTHQGWSARRRPAARWLERTIAAIVAVGVPSLVWAATEATPAMSGWVDRVGDGLAPLVGAWITREAFLGIRWITACASLLSLALVGLADLVLRVLVRRKIKRDERASRALVAQRRIRYWIDRGLEAALPPLVLLVWIYGISAALYVLLIEVAWREEAGLVLEAGRWLKSVGVLVGEVWLLYRLSRVAEGWIRTLASGEGTRWDEIIVPLAGTSVRLAVPLLGLILALPTLDFSPTVQA